MNEWNTILAVFVILLILISVIVVGVVLTVNKYTGNEIFSIICGLLVGAGLLFLLDRYL